VHPVADEGAVGRVAARVGELADTYEPPGFDHVPGADAALFLCAVDHGTGYREAQFVDGRGPFEGSALLWELGCAEERARPGTLSAAALADVDAARVDELFRAGDERVRDPEGRARLWRDLAAGLERDYDGQTTALIAASEGRLGGEGGLVAALSRYEAYADPLAKKAFLFAKIAERRGWLEVADPESWQVCADNVLMRLALRSGLVEPGGVEDVRAATREAFAAVAAESGVPVPVLDDLLWELGREDPDLLGTAAGELREPPRRGGVHWY
jgi:hypothetical protein